MRHEYHLTRQTEKALSRNITQIADDMDVTRQHLHNILGGVTTDPYSPFRSMFKSISRKNKQGAEIYLRDLTLIHEANHTQLRKPTCKASLTGNIGKEYVEFIESVMQGKSLAQQLKELDDIRKVLDETREHLINEYNVSKTKDKTADVLEIRKAG